MICYSIMFRVCLSVRKSYEPDELGHMYVCAHGYVLRSRLAKEHQSVENIDLVRKHRSELDVLFLRRMDCKLRSQLQEAGFPEMS